MLGASDVDVRKECFGSAVHWCGKVRGMSPKSFF